MGADNALEREAVTVDGQHLVATPEKNKDLYWALSGGGPGTFAVVLSLTARLHKDSVVGGTILSFNDSAVGNERFWDAVAAWHTILPSFLDSGNSFTYLVGAKEFTAYGTMPGADLNKTNQLLKPFLDDLKKRGITPSNAPRTKKQLSRPLLRVSGARATTFRDYGPIHDQPDLSEQTDHR